MKNIFIAILLYQTVLHGQILFTGVDKLTGTVKAYYLIEETGQIIELSSGNSYLPRWLNDEFIVLNIGNSIFKVDKFGNNKIYFFDGFMPVVSRSGKYIAAYSKEGIIIADSTGKILSKVEVDYWHKVTLMFSYDEKHIFYYDKTRNACFLFDWGNQTNRFLASHLYHPTYSPDGEFLLVNIGKVDSNFRVAIVPKNWQEGKPLNYITSPYENSIVPIWSPSGRYIAYMILHTQHPLENSDFIPASIILYDRTTKSKFVIAENAGFTEGAYPQFSFNGDEKYLYYTSILENGNGTISRIDLSKNFEKMDLINDKFLDARLPISFSKP